MLALSNCYFLVMLIFVIDCVIQIERLIEIQT